ncbi:MAG: hypothetical protein E6Q97_31480 [Desulfurellales bacterium]|nr:MAG: hypothetical protein E6Q97_31480 [Desulfurellales bacterium]
MNYPTEIDQLAANLAGGLSLDELRRKQARNPYERRAPRAEEKIEAERRYWDKVNAQQPEKTRGIRFGRVLEQEMSYEEARKKFWARMQMRAAEISMLENNPEWTWSMDDEFSRNIRNLIKWAINDPTGELPVHKGLFVFGATGTGKTEIITCLARFCEQYDLSKRFTLCSMSVVYDRTREDKDYLPVQDNLPYDRAFDEFGRHTGPVMRYGDPLDVNEAIVEARYQRFRNYGQLTHFVANMAPNDAARVFSPMVLDRLRHMTTSVHFTGESRRK